MSTPVTSLVRHFARRWRYPRLLVVAATLLAVDILIPDAVPFADEVLLALITLALSRLRPTLGAPPGPPDDGP